MGSSHFLILWALQLHWQISFHVILDSDTKDEKSILEGSVLHRPYDSFFTWDEVTCKYISVLLPHTGSRSEPCCQFWAMARNEPHVQSQEASPSFWAEAMMIMNAITCTPVNFWITVVDVMCLPKQGEQMTTPVTYCRFRSKEKLVTWALPLNLFHFFSQGLYLTLCFQSLVTIRVSHYTVFWVSHGSFSWRRYREIRTRNDAEMIGSRCHWAKRYV